MTDEFDKEFAEIFERLVTSIPVSFYDEAFFKELASKLDIRKDGDFIRAMDWIYAIKNLFIRKGVPDNLLFDKQGRRMTWVK